MSLVSAEEQLRGLVRSYRHEKMEDAERIELLEKLVLDYAIVTSNPSEWEGGNLSHMNELRCRLNFYVELIPLRHRAREALKLEEEDENYWVDPRAGDII